MCVCVSVEGWAVEREAENRSELLREACVRDPGSPSSGARHKGDWPFSAPTCYAATRTCLLCLPDSCTSLRLAAFRGRFFRFFLPARSEPTSLAANKRAVSLDDAHDLQPLCGKHVRGTAVRDEGKRLKARARIQRESQRAEASSCHRHGCENLSWPKSGTMAFVERTWCV